MNIHIEHAALYTNDIEKAKAFYVTYFGGKSNTLYQNSKGFTSYFITFDSGARLEIMHHTGLTKKDTMDKVNGWNHIAFSVGSRDEVLKITGKITADGYELYSPPRVTGDGYFESCVADPDGNRVEITE